MRSVYEGIGFCLEYIDDCFYTLGEDNKPKYVKKSVNQPFPLDSLGPEFSNRKCKPWIGCVYLEARY